MSLFGDDDRRNAYRALLANRDYRLLFASGLGSGLGDWIGLFALQVLVISLADPGSRLALFGLGGIMMARVLPSVLLGPFAGVVSDRFDRKRLLIICDLARAATFGAIALSANLAVIFALTFIAECFTLLYLTAKNAVIPAYVEEGELAEANQLNMIVSYGPLPFGAAVATLMSWIAGLLAGAAIIDVDPTRLALWFNALTFAGAGLLLVRLRRAPSAADDEAAEDEAADDEAAEDADSDGDAANALTELKDGFAFIRGEPLIRSLLLGVITAFFGAGALVALGPEFVRSVLGKAESDWYGFMTILGFGLLGGLMASTVAMARLRGQTVFNVSLVAAGLAAVGAALATSFPVLQLIAFPLGALVGASFVAGYTLLQVHSPDRVRGRTFAALFTGTRLALFLSLGLGPLVAAAIGTISIAGVDISGIRVVVLGGGLIGLVGALYAARGIAKADETDR
jgi:dTMP kinase